MSKQKKWTTDDIPDQQRRLVVVTGANSGIGYHTTRALALKGARVIMACRDRVKAEEARRQILLDSPLIAPEVWDLDLSNLGLVKAFAERLRNSHVNLDILINNAGLMAIPYNTTRDGFEMQFGVNHLGHFALTAHLWPLIKGTRGARIVNVSSAAHHFGKIRYEDIHWKNGYSKWGAYGRSKLSNLLLTKELSRKLTASKSAIIVSSAHPGYSSTNLYSRSYQMSGSWIGADSFNFVNRLVGQSAEMGALPTLYAATAEFVKQGSFYGPSGFMRLRGWPAAERPNSRRVTEAEARKLWRVSEELVELKFEVD